MPFHGLLSPAKKLCVLGMMRMAARMSRIGLGALLEDEAERRRRLLEPGGAVEGDGHDRVAGPHRDVDGSVVGRGGPRRGDGERVRVGYGADRADLTRARAVDDGHVAAGEARVEGAGVDQRRCAAAVRRALLVADEVDDGARALVGRRARGCARRCGVAVGARPPRKVSVRFWSGAGVPSSM